MTYFAELIQQLENITTDREAPVGAAVRAARESGGDDDRREAAWAAPAPPPSARRRRVGVRILFPIGVDLLRQPGLESSDDQVETEVELVVHVAVAHKPRNLDQMERRVLGQCPS